MLLTTYKTTRPNNPEDIHLLTFIWFAFLISGTSHSCVNSDMHTCVSPAVQLKTLKLSFKMLFVRHSLVSEGVCSSFIVTSLNEDFKILCRYVFMMWFIMKTKDRFNT